MVRTSSCGRHVTAQESHDIIIIIDKTHYLRSGHKTHYLRSGHYQVVRIASLAAALVKLNIKISIESFLKAIRDEDEAMREEEIERTPHCLNIS